MISDLPILISSVRLAYCTSNSWWFHEMTQLLERSRSTLNARISSSRALRSSSRVYQQITSTQSISCTVHCAYYTHNMSFIVSVTTPKTPEKSRLFSTSMSVSGSEVSGPSTVCKVTFSEDCVWLESIPWRWWFKNPLTTLVSSLINCRIPCKSELASHPIQTNGIME